MAMQFEAEAVVNGVTFFHGVIDGKELDSGTMFILEELETKNGNAAGSRTTENKCVSSETIKRILKNTFPSKFKLVYERQVTKAGEKLIIIDARPIGSVHIPATEKKAA
ncbi:MAG: hypothetical protein K2P67_07475 [Gallionellaceae bacterium]|nr:hypothetical protein [Gallionellaceae bacterium]